MPTTYHHRSSLLKMLFLFSVLTLLAALTGCQFGVSVKNQVSLCESTFRSGKTMDNECRFKVDESLQALNIDFSAEMEEGTLYYRLAGPDGDIAWQGEVESGKSQDTLTEIADPAAGTWVMVFHIVEGKGQYRAETTYRN